MGKVSSDFDPNEFVLTFRAPNDRAKVHQNRQEIKIATA